MPYSFDTCDLSQLGVGFDYDQILPDSQEAVSIEGALSQFFVRRPVKFHLSLLGLLAAATQVVALGLLHMRQQQQ